VPSLSDARSGCSVRSLRRRGVGVEHHLRLAWGGEQRDAARKKVHLRVWQRVLPLLVWTREGGAPAPRRGHCESKKKR